VSVEERTAGWDPAASHDVHELISDLRRSGVTIFLTTHRLEEAARLCDRVAILNTTLRTIGRPDELRDRLFARTLTVRTVKPLPEPGRVFANLPAADGWRQEGRDHLHPHRVRSGRRGTGSDPCACRERCRCAVDWRVPPLA